MRPFTIKKKTGKHNKKFRVLNESKEGRYYLIADLETGDMAWIESQQMLNLYRYYYE